MNFFYDGATYRARSRTDGAANHDPQIGDFNIALVTREAKYNAPGVAAAPRLISPFSSRNKIRSQTAFFDLQAALVEVTLCSDSHTASTVRLADWPEMILQRGAIIALSVDLRGK